MNRDELGRFLAMKQAAEEEDEGSGILPWLAGAGGLAALGGGGYAAREPIKKFAGEAMEYGKGALGKVLARLGR